MEFIEKLPVCDKDVIQSADIITYVYFVQEAMGKYHIIVESKQWGLTDTKYVFQDENFPLKAFTGKI